MFIALSMIFVIILISVNITALCFILAKPPKWHENIDELQIKHIFLIFILPAFILSIPMYFIIRMFLWVAKIKFWDYVIFSKKH